MRTWVWIAVPALLLASGCSKKTEQPATPTTLHEVMKNEVDTRGDDVWAVGNKHMTEDAGLSRAHGASRQTTRRPAKGVRSPLIPRP